MKRKIIRIDHDLCNGCGDCIPNCPEGALQIIDNKAHLISDLFCDGLGACIGTCPLGAIRIEEREAEPYDERKVMENVISHGEAVIKAHLEHLQEHGETGYLKEALEFLKEKGIKIPSLKPPDQPQGCPGARMREITAEESSAEESPDGQSPPSRLRTWPVQLHLLNPNAPYLKKAELVIAADCTAFAHGDFHRRFLAGRIPVIFCPKLDEGIDRYIDKLAHVFSENDIRGISVVKMQVPCCGGILQIVREALKRSGKEIAVEDTTISLTGEVLTKEKTPRPTG